MHTRVMEQKNSSGRPSSDPVELRHDLRFADDAS